MENSCEENTDTKSSDSKTKGKMRTKKKSYYSIIRSRRQWMARRRELSGALKNAEDTLEQFLQFCNEQLDLQGIQTLIQKKFDACTMEYKASYDLLDLIALTQAKMESDKSKPYVYLRDFLKCLNEQNKNEVKKAKIKSQQTVQNTSKRKIEHEGSPPVSEASQKKLKTTDQAKPTNSSTSTSGNSSTALPQKPKITKNKQKQLSAGKASSATASTSSQNLEEQDEDDNGCETIWMKHHKRACHRARSTGTFNKYGYMLFKEMFSVSYWHVIHYAVLKPCFLSRPTKRSTVLKGLVSLDTGISSWHVIHYAVLKPCFLSRPAKRSTVLKGLVSLDTTKKDVLNNLYCTACGKKLQNVVSKSLLLHPDLSTIICKKCYDDYNKRKTKRNSGANDYCRWCAKAGELSDCKDCLNKLCDTCVQRNFGSFLMFTYIRNNRKPCFLCSGKMKYLQELSRDLKEEITWVEGKLKEHSNNDEDFQAMSVENENTASHKHNYALLQNRKIWSVYDQKFFNLRSETGGLQLLGGLAFEKMIETESATELRCTACGKGIPNPDTSSLILHPYLKVIICKGCDMKLRKDDGLFDRCRWCAVGKKSLGCYKCENVYCCGCIIRNFGKKMFWNVPKKRSLWMCFKCTDALKCSQDFCRDFKAEIAWLEEIEKTGVEISVDENRTESSTKDKIKKHGKSFERRITRASRSQPQQKDVEVQASNNDLDESDEGTSLFESYNSVLNDTVVLNQACSVPPLYESPILYNSSNESDDQGIEYLATSAAEDLDNMSIRGIFGWESIGGVNVPCIFRREKKFLAVRIVQTKLWPKFLEDVDEDRLQTKIYCVTQAEATLLNEINKEHCGCQYGRKSFTTKDSIVGVDWLKKMYNAKNSPQKQIKIMRSHILSKVNSTVSNDKNKDSATVNSISSQLSQHETPVIHQFNFHGTNINVKTFNKNVVIPNDRLVPVDSENSQYPVFLTAFQNASSSSKPHDSSSDDCAVEELGNNALTHQQQSFVHGQTGLLDVSVTSSDTVQVSHQQTAPITSTIIPSVTVPSGHIDQQVFLGQQNVERTGGELQSGSIVSQLNEAASHSTLSFQNIESTSKLHSKDTEIPVITSIQGNANIDDLISSQSSQNPIFIIDDSPEDPVIVLSSDGEEEMPDPPVRSASPSPDLSCFAEEPFRGQKIACLNIVPNKYCLVHAVRKQYFPSTSIEEIIYAIENVLKIELVDCSRDELKAFQLFYRISSKDLDCEKMITFKDLCENFLQISYMHPQT